MSFNEILSCLTMFMWPISVGPDTYRFYTIANNEDEARKNIFCFLNHIYEINIKYSPQEYIQKFNQKFYLLKRESERIKELLEYYEQISKRLEVLKLELLDIENIDNLDNEKEQDIKKLFTMNNKRITKYPSELYKFSNAFNKREEYDEIENEIMKRLTITDTSVLNFKKILFQRKSDVQNRIHIYEQEIFDYDTLKQKFDSIEKDFEASQVEMKDFEEKMLQMYKTKQNVALSDWSFNVLSKFTRDFLTADKTNTISDVVSKYSPEELKFYNLKKNAF